jgi:phosphatidylglycerophosphatase A
MQPPPWTDPALLAATCGGVGRAPVAPGTFGSLVGLPVSLALGAGAAWLASRLPSAGPGVAIALEAGIIAVIFLVGIPICTRAAALLGGKDPGPVVFDEAIAAAAVLLAVPLADRGPAVLAAAFVLFRIFDILKPPPIRRIERLPAGLGIMADDMAAAAYAAACLAVARWQGWL